MRAEELVLVESGFNALVVITKISILYFNGIGNEMLFYAFVLFFLIQTIGFVKQEIQEGRNMSAMRSCTLFLCILNQARALYEDSDGHPSNIIDSQGRFLVFGHDAPWTLIAHYFFWVLGVLYIDYACQLPHSAFHAVHLGSVVLSGFSSEFWHSRLLTASHLFVMDAILLFREGFTVIESEFARMPDNLVKKYDQWIPLLNMISFVGCLICMASSFVCGPYSLFCLGDEPMLKYVVL